MAVPPLQSRVTDLTGTLNAQQRAALEQTLEEFEARKGSQIAVLLVPTTQPETAVEYGVRVFDAWKLGRRGVDDGALLLVAKEDRRVWIVTGRGLEGPLPDAAVKRIVEDDITPRFRGGDFYGGIRAGTDRIMRTLEGEPLPAPRRGAPAGPVGQAVHLNLEWLIPAFIVLMIAQSLLNRIFGRFLGSGLTGGVAGFLAWIVVGSMIAAVFIGMAAFLFSLIGGLPHRRLSGGGWPGGGWSGGGWSGGSGGGGFSGGGGSTAGGGAGGSW